MVNTLKISVAVITYNRAEALGKCLASLAKQTRKPCEVIVIDSSDGGDAKQISRSAKKLPVKYRHFPGRMHQCRARNEALKLCKGDIIAFLDDDCIASGEWLENIARGYSYASTAAVGGPCINVNEGFSPAEKIIHGDGNRSFISFTGDVVCEARRWVPDRPVFTNVLAGGNMSFLAKELRRIGFDEFYDRNAAFREETDPQIALQKSGWKILYMPGALVYHLNLKQGGIFSGGMKDYYYWCGVNHRYLVDKYGFSKFWSRFSWLTFSRNPPSLPLGFLLSLVRFDTSLLGWYKGLFSGA